MLYDDGENFVSIICSEKQGSDAGLQELYRLGLMKSTVSPVTFTGNPGMVSRVFYDEKGRITGHEVLDKYGQKINIPHGTFPSPEPVPSVGGYEKIEPESNPLIFFRDQLPRWKFHEFEAALKGVTENFSPAQAVEQLTQIHDQLIGWDTGAKDRGALIHIVLNHIDSFLDSMNGGKGMFRVTSADAGKLKQPEDMKQVLGVDARGFRPEGGDPLRVLSCFLDHAHRMGWRRFIVYRVEGQRGSGGGMG